MSVCVPGYSFQFSEENDPSLFKSNQTNNDRIKQRSTTENQATSIMSSASIKTTSATSTKNKKTSTTATLIEQDDLNYRRRGTVSDLFAALEQDNITMLQQIAAGVKQFDRLNSLPLSLASSLGYRLLADCCA